MMQGGQWDNILGDCLPLALANLYHCPVRIYSSKITTPVYDIQPNLNVVETAPANVINLAYLAMRGSEHYNGVADFNVDTDTHNGNVQKDPDQLSPETQTTPQPPTPSTSPKVTPHKRANYQSPKKKLTTRKRLRKPDTWMRNIRKEKRNSGKDYISSQGKHIPGKSPKPSNCTKCRFKCNSKFSEDERLSIFESYYKLGCYERQADYIGHMVDCVSPVRTIGKRQVSKKFHLPTHGSRTRVCRDFFVKTLDIGKKKVDYITAKKSSGLAVSKDNRGKQTSANTIDQDILNKVHEHIQSFPKMESQYSRQSSTKHYLSNDLNIRKMYSLYVEHCKAK